MHNPRGCWRECAAAALALFCCIGLNINAFSVSIPYLTKLLELSYSQSSNFIMVRSLFAFGSMFFVKFYYDKLEIRLGYTLAIVLAALASLLYACAGSFIGLCIAAAVSGLASGLGGMYPAAILIHRWFPCHEGLAMGICAASTGFAIIVGAPIVTALTESFSARHPLIWETGLFLICAVVCFLLIRNFPKGVLHHKIERHAKRQPLRLSWMFFAVLALGAMGNTGYSHLAMHYTTEGFAPYQVSSIVSAVGLCLVIGKFVLGEVIDLWGTYRSSWLFLSVVTVGCFMCGIGGTAGYVPAMLSACVFGFGDSITTVGLTAYAKDLSTPEEYATTQQQYQMAFMLGGLLSGSLPGLIADYTTSYRGFYIFIAVLTIFATTVIQRQYIKLHRASVKHT